MTSSTKQKTLLVLGLVTIVTIMIAASLGENSVVLIPAAGKSFATSPISKFIGVTLPAQPKET